MATLSSDLDHPQSFHPTSISHLSILDPVLLECDIHAYLSLQPSLFVDIYELRNYEHSFTFLHEGNANLELPVSAVNGEGSSVLFTILNPSHDRSLELTIPLHARYGLVTNDSSHSHDEIEFRSPQVFFVCPQADRFTSSTTFTSTTRLPSDMAPSFRLALGWPRTGPSSSKVAVTPELSVDSMSTHWLHVPVGYSGDLPIVALGTAITILGMFVFIAWEMVNLSKRAGEGSKVEKKKTKAE
ncbi:PIG-X [Flagelloscypha sp. PMI_526]|nr:PIG-X [Flagelloscypha sp. PMI_526]